MEEVILGLVSEAYANLSKSSKEYEKRQIIETLIRNIKESLTTTPYTMEFREIEGHWVYSIAWLEENKVRMKVLDFKNPRI